VRRPWPTRGCCPGKKITDVQTTGRHVRYEFYIGLKFHVTRFVEWSSPVAFLNNHVLQPFGVNCRPIPFFQNCHTTKSEIPDQSAEVLKALISTALLFVKVTVQHYHIHGSFNNRKIHSIKNIHTYIHTYIHSMDP
jgi:hypothetical protein